MFKISGGFSASRDMGRLLDYCNNLGFSDLYIQTGWPMIIAVHGRKKTITTHKMRDSEVGDIANELYGHSNGASLINKGSPIDTAYDYRPERGVRFRYRVNGSGTFVDGSLAISLTVRRLMNEPPHKSEIGLTDELIDMFAGYDNGIAIISGTTGSGKSTTMASVVRDVLEGNDGKIILTAESPIEYVYDSLIDKALQGDEPSMIASSSIPLNFSSFEAAGVASLRRAPDIILIGEARDADTIDASIEASNTGHMVWATTHSNGAPMTIRRMVQKYSPDVQSAKMGDLIEALRLVVSQTLAKTIDGKRIALHEVLHFTPEVREHMINGKPEDVYRLSREAMHQWGKPMIVEAIEAFNNGIIDQHELSKVKRTYGG